MNFSHREERRADRLLDILTSEENGLRLAVSRLGAELISVARRDKSGRWIGFLHRDNDLSAPAKGWTNHATVMGYYLHRLKNGRTLYRGQEIRGGNHSFLRTTNWHFVPNTSSSVRALTYNVSQRDYSPDDYPLNVSLDLSYEIREEDVAVTFQFTNHEKELTAHLGFGLHPGFAATSFDSFTLQMPAGRYRRYFSPTNYPSGETQEIEFQGGPIPFERKDLPGSYILELVDVPQPTFVVSDPPTGRKVALDLSGVPYVTLWSDGGPFLCVEPCWGLTDHDQQRPFEDKEGIQTVAPASILTAQFRFSPQLEN
jgi:galactose mutarotase-like enzyme